MGKLRIVAMMVFLQLLTACAGAIDAEPEYVRSINTELEIVQALGDLPVSGETITAEDIIAIDLPQRNLIVQTRLYEIDLRYQEFERNLLLESRNVDFVAQIGELGVDIAGSFVGGNASQILSAISAGITGSQAAFNERMLFDRTIQALVSQMRADRATLKRDIILRLNQSITRYPVMQALTDVADYRAAGTLLGAVIGLAARAADEAEKSEGQLQQVLSVPYGPDEASGALVAFLTEGRMSSARDAFAPLIVPERLEAFDSAVRAYHDQNPLPQQIMSIVPAGRALLLLIGAEEEYTAARLAILERLREADEIE